MPVAVQDGRPDHPGIIAPPPLIFAGLLLLGIGLGWLVDGPGFRLSDGMSWTVSGILIAAALAINFPAAAQFLSARTHIHPWKPAKTLVTTGIYQYSRNPMYLGMALGYAGFSLLADSIMALAGLPVALVIMHYGVIKREERYLEAKFGNSYSTYRRNVRRWI